MDEYQKFLQLIRAHIIKITPAGIMTVQLYDNWLFSQYFMNFTYITTNVTYIPNKNTRKEVKLINWDITDWKDLVLYI